MSAIKFKDVDGKQCDLLSTEIKDVRIIYTANKPHSVEIVTKKGDFLVENKTWNQIKNTLNEKDHVSFSLQDKGYKKPMKAEIINAKAVRLIDIDNLEHTALVEDVKECLIERDGKKLKYFVKISNFLGVFGIDHDTYNFLLALIKESVEVCSKKPVMETWETSSKEIAFIDSDGEKHTVLAKDVQGLSLAKFGNHLEYFVKLFSEGYYSMRVSSKTYYILLATLRSFARPKEKDNDKSKEKKEKK